MILNPQQLSGQAWVTNFDPKTRSNVEKIDLILMLSERGPKNCLMLGSCWLSLAKEMSSFFWPALNPVPEQVYFNMSSHMLDLVAYSKFWVARQFDCLAMALCIVLSM